MYSWFTPAVLFLFLNPMIGTIAVSSSVLGQKQKPQQGNEQWQAPLAQAPSVRERLKSINLYRLRSGEMSAFHSATMATTVQPSETETHYAVEQTRDEEEDEEREEEEEETPREETRKVETLDSNPDQFMDHHVMRSMSDMEPAFDEVPAKLAQKMKKSASSKSAFEHFAEELVERQRPSMVKEEKSKAIQSQLSGDDQEVDAKADDFINRFKQQLKLERLDSIIHYKDMINRVASQ